MCDNGFTPAEAPAWGFDQLSCCGGCGFLTAQFAALADLYVATNGPQWATGGSAGWANYNTSDYVDPCLNYWPGIICNGLGITCVSQLYIDCVCWRLIACVIVVSRELRLDNNNLAGTLPSTLSALSLLRYAALLP